MAFAFGDDLDQLVVRQVCSDWKRLIEHHWRLRARIRLPTSMGHIAGYALRKQYSTLFTWALTHYSYTPPHDEPCEQIIRKLLVKGARLDSRSYRQAKNLPLELIKELYPLHREPRSLMTMACHHRRFDVLYRRQ
jgi:hypothetical protein